jgi:hypothetical protein
MATSEIICTSTEGDARDNGEDVCEWYVGKEGSCGKYDDGDFEAASLCCECGGGDNTNTGIAFFADDHDLRPSIAANWCG